ncbi:MAG: hypothetical protein R3F59_29940 [Myxococcota bacterium]
MLLALPAVAAVGAVGWVLVDPQVPGVAMPSPGVLAVTAAAIGAAFGAGVAYALVLAVDLAVRRRAAPDWRWWTAFGVGGTALVVATWMRGHNGGFLNVLMPGHLALCLGLGVAVVEARRWLPGPAVALSSAGWLVLQVAWLDRLLEVDDVLPSAEDRAAGEAVVERLRACPDGPILSPYAAWLPVQAGRAPSPHLIAIWDIRYPDGPFFDGIARLTEAAEAHRWSCVVKGGRQPMGFGVEQNYQRTGTFDIPPRALMPKTGWRVRPSELWEPRP